MSEKHELLKAAGFSDEFIAHIEQFDASIPKLVIPTVDPRSIIYKSIDTTQLSIQNNSGSAALSVHINPSA